MRRMLCDRDKERLLSLVIASEHRVEMLDHRRGVGAHVMARGHLRGATVTPPVVRNDAIVVRKEEQHLRVVPVVA